MRQQLCMTVNKIFNWSPIAHSDTVFTLQFYSNKTQQLIVEKKIQGVYSLNNMFLNSALKINYTDEQRQVLLKMGYGSEQICSFCIDLVSLKEKRVQYLPFPGKDKVLQINLTDFDPYQNKIKEKNIQDFPVENLNSHQAFLRQRELFLHNSYANQQNMRRNFSQNINRLLNNMNTHTNPARNPYYFRGQRDERQEQQNYIGYPHYRQYSGHKQPPKAVFPQQKSSYRHPYYNQPNEYDDYELERLNIRNPTLRQYDYELQRKIQYQKKMQRVSSQKIFNHKFQTMNTPANFMNHFENRQARQREFAYRNYHMKSQRNREDSKDAKSSSSSNHKLILNTLNVVPKQEYYVQKGRQIRGLQKDDRKSNYEANYGYLNCNRNQNEAQRKSEQKPQTFEKGSRQTQQQDNIRRQERSSTLEKAKQKEEKIQKLFSEMSKHYQFQQKLKKIEEHRNQIYK